MPFKCSIGMVTMFWWTNQPMRRITRELFSNKPQSDRVTDKKQQNRLVRRAGGEERS